MTATLKTFESFMEDALLKCLPDLSLERSPPPAGAETLVRARLGFEGAGMKAQAFISCTASLLQATCPLPSGSSGHSDGVKRDWLGELGNLTLGRLKNRLLAHGITIKISAPRFDSEWIAPEGATSLVTWFESEVGVIGFECAIDGPIPSIGEALKQTAEILPGDAIYRLNDPVNAPPSYDIVSKIRSGVQQSEAQGGEAEEDELATIDSISEIVRQDYAAEKAAARDAKVSPKPLRILFHAAAPVPALTGIAWSQIDKLLLHFSSGLEYSICPHTLLEQGNASFEVESLLVSFEREGDLIRISIPKLNIQLSKFTRVA